MNHQLDASYRHCQQIAQRSASSFYYSILLLPKPKRLAMCALYAFLRRADDLGDSLETDPSAPNGMAAPPSTSAERRRALMAWRESLARAVRGQYDDPLFPALADTLARFAIPIDYLHQVIDGVEMDLEPVVYETFEQLETYCHRVASAVGLACLHIWGPVSSEAEWPARQCGVAFQLTNILRDLKEDAVRRRVYLPRQDLARFDYTIGDLLSGVQDERFRRLMRFEIERTERIYAEAAQLEPHLTADGRRVYGSMMAVYRALLDEIKRLDGGVLSTRVRLSRWRKMRIATRCLLFGAPRRDVAGAGAT